VQVRQQIPVAQQGEHAHVQGRLEIGDAGARQGKAVATDDVVGDAPCGQHARHGVAGPAAAVDGGGGLHLVDALAVAGQGVVAKTLPGRHGRGGGHAAGFRGRLQQVQGDAIAGGGEFFQQPAGRSLVIAVGEVQARAAHAQAGQMRENCMACSLRVVAVGGEQFGVAAALDDAALVHHQDRVGRSMVDRRWAITSVVRPAHHAVEGGLDVALGFGVEGRGGFVEDEDRRVLEQARAMARRWRWPPESSTPFSPTRVSKPCGSGR
jgi:hypothetical protein